MTADFQQAFQKRVKKDASTLSNPAGINHVTDFISTRCLPLDIIMGGMGVPVGRLVEMYGDTSTGKTMIALQVLAECQARGGIAVMLDSETTTDIDIASAVGIDPETLIYENPETIEDVWSYIEKAISAKQEIKCNEPMVIVWDSVASTSALEEIAKMQKDGLNSRSMGVHARLLSAMCRNLPAMLARNRTTCIFINQVRDKIGVMFGDKETTPGGRALAFYSSVRVKLDKVRNISDAGQVIGMEGRATISKSKIAPPYGRCNFPIYFGEGVDNPDAVQMWIIQNKIGEYTGGVWQKMILQDGTELKWQKKGWHDTYTANKDAIDALCLESGYATAFAEDNES
jgi:recombination protein RecA